MVRLMREVAGLQNYTLCTRQHPELLDDLLPILDWKPDETLDALPPSDMSRRLGSLLEGLQQTVEDFKEKPDVVLVQGDTFSTLAGAMMARYHGLPVVHLEAGLRTYDIAHPFPEELHRQTLGRVASLHLAPTEKARNNLINEGVSGTDIVVTGNTVVDALMMMQSRMKAPACLNDFQGSAYGLVTLHRREHAGVLARNIAEGLLEARRREKLPLVIVRHPNEEVSRPFCAMFEGLEGVRVIPPVSYPEMLWLVRNARIVVTDSGGLQEESSAMGVPVGIVRYVTDRSEAVDAGCARLLGVEPRSVCEGLVSMLQDIDKGEVLALSRTIFGDGNASQRALEALLERWPV